MVDSDEGAGPALIRERALMFSAVFLSSIAFILGLKEKKKKNIETFPSTLKNCRLVPAFKLCWLRRANCPNWNKNVNVFVTIFPEEK